MMEIVARLIQVASRYSRQSSKRQGSGEKERQRQLRARVRQSLLPSAILRACPSFTPFSLRLTSSIPSRLPLPTLPHTTSASLCFSLAVRDELLSKKKEKTTNKRGTVK